MENASAKVSSRVELSASFWLALLAICVGLLFGGGTFQWLPSEFLCQVFGAIFLAVGLFQAMRCAGAARWLWELGLAAALPLVPAIQLIPLPSWLWTMLPGRHFLVEEFSAVGATPLPWQSISLSPDATWQALLSLVLPLSIFVAGLLLTFRERRFLSLAVMTLVGLGIVIALMQLLQGPESALRFYTLTNESLPVGFFANRNHFGALLYCALPMSAAWTIALAVESRPSSRGRGAFHKNTFLLLASAAFFVALLLMQGLVHSRAGLFITVLALGLSISLTAPFRRSELGKKAIKIILGLSVFAVILIGCVALPDIVQQFGHDPVEDLRFTIVKGSLRAMRAFFRVGAGFGTFDVVYQRFEQPADATSEYVNRAHDDIIETVIEGGVFSVAVALFLFLWLARRTWGVWTLSVFREASIIDAGLARGAAFIPLMLGLHSFLDYALRTEALMSFLAFACALVVPPIDRVSEGPRESKRRRRRMRRSSPKWTAPQLPGRIA